MYIPICHHLSPPPFFTHFPDSTPFSLSQAMAFAVQISVLEARSYCSVFSYQFDLWSFEVFAAVDEPLEYANNDDDEEGDDAVI